MTVPIVNDEVFENTENLSISLGTPSDSRITVMPPEGVIEIEDDDGKSSVLVYRLTHPNANLCSYKHKIWNVVISWHFFPLTVAVIGLERTFYSVEEGPGAVVEVCAVVYQPTGSCPIGFSFTVPFSTGDITAG